MVRQAGQGGTYDRVEDFKAERKANKKAEKKAEKEANKKERGPDQKSVMANERTLLAWLRTTMLLLYGSSYFLDHDIEGGVNKVLGWIGISSALGVVLWAQWRYNKRNKMLLSSEMNIAKYSDQYGTNFLVLCTIICSIVGLIAYQKSVLTYHVQQLGVHAHRNYWGQMSRVGGVRWTGGERLRCRFDVCTMSMIVNC